MTELPKLGRLIIYLQYFSSLCMWMDMCQGIQDQTFQLPIHEREAGLKAYRSQLETLGGCLFNMMRLPVDDERAAHPNEFEYNFGY